MSSKRAFEILETERKRRDGTRRGDSRERTVKDRALWLMHNKGLSLCPFKQNRREREKRKRSFWADNLEQERHLFQKREK